MKSLKKFIFASDGKFKPPYFWATVLLALLVLSVILQIYMVVSCFMQKKPELQLSLVPLIGVLAGLATALIAVYNQGKRRPVHSDPGAYKNPPESLD
jgi:peptidoglycan biosynthesis protein MviN/MurJ (putative lipid II flippase)